ncbi:MAG: hypothetical protein K2Y37_05850 [Pirellulales bacterium]|nr:hypothetical protein [Pirellulales bacterium]
MPRANSKADDRHVTSLSFFASWLRTCYDYRQAIDVHYDRALPVDSG